MDPDPNNTYRLTATNIYWTTPAMSDNGAEVVHLSAPQQWHTTLDLTGRPCHLSEWRIPVGTMTFASLDPDPTRIQIQTYQAVPPYRYVVQPPKMEKHLLILSEARSIFGNE
ncbi:hypothetical protein EJ110_NYTH58244 [Nymphaea thermarum]|nr:hypothetical protein EJ110_NYTH58244 [Nymphaea thermarum]